MERIQSKIVTSSPEFKKNKEYHTSLVRELKDKLPNMPSMPTNIFSSKERDVPQDRTIIIQITLPDDVVVDSGEKGGNKVDVVMKNVTDSMNE